ncbi:MAG TPA: hypothetical protein VM307_13435 [Egibacteraceae bacterium]|nr:hypothetical protein [Egibacteraceae bacterium]
MSRIGLTVEQLLVSTWSAAQRPTYAAHVPGLNVLTGETLALVGTGTAAVVDQLLDALPACTVIDGGAAAQAGTLRIHAQQAARVGVTSLVVTDPFVATDGPAHALAVADLAGLRSLGVTTAVEVADADVGATFADRVVVVHDGRVSAAYPVVAPTPRTRSDIDPVTRRVAARLAAHA